MKNAPWISALRIRNVDIVCLAACRGARAVGKGLWSMPDLMKPCWTQVGIQEEQLRLGCHGLGLRRCTQMHYHYRRCSGASDEIKRAVPVVRWKTCDDPRIAGRNLSDADIAQRLKEKQAQEFWARRMPEVIRALAVQRLRDIHTSADGRSRDMRISDRTLANWLHHGVFREFR